MAHRMVADDMARRDIGGDALLAAFAIRPREIPRGNEEARLTDAPLAERRDQRAGPLVGREEGAGVARHVIEAESDPLLRYCGTGKREDCQKDEQKTDDRYPTVGTANASFPAALPPGVISSAVNFCAISWIRICWPLRSDWLVTVIL